jgi:hypothetical protein
MPQEPHKLSSEVFAPRLVALGRKLRLARTLASRSEELLDAAECELNDLRAMLMGSKAVPVEVSQAPRRAGMKLRSGRRPGKSSKGVVSVLMVPQPDDSSVACLEERTRLSLPKSVAALLDVLKAEGGVVTDDLVGWKSVAAIQAALKERTKQSRSKSAVKELVYRLRKLLEQNGEDPLLVQNNRRLGYRFALRCRVPTKTECDNL